MNKNNIAIGVILAVIGLLMLIIPEQCVKAVVIMIGLGSALNGVYSLVHTRKLVPDASFQYVIISRAMMSIVVGLLAFLLPLTVAKAMWTAMIYVLAVYLLVYAGMVLYALGMIRDSSVDRRQFLLEALIAFAAAVAMFIIPAKIGIAFVRLSGAALILAGAAYIFYAWRNRPAEPVEAEVIDDI
ncbi:MAG: DUF308 domain-containing protein [Treponema sp.]